MPYGWPPTGGGLPKLRCPSTGPNLQHAGWAVSYLPRVADRTGRGRRHGRRPHPRPGRGAGPGGSDRGAGRGAPGARGADAGPGRLTAVAWKGPLLALPLAVLACSEPRRKVAITFDDLPVDSRRDWPANDTITSRLLSALQKSGAPIIGFVNEGNLYAQPGRPPDPSRVALLTRWVAAGFELGNHTYSHADLHAVGPA